MSKTTTHIPNPKKYLIMPFFEFRSAMETISLLNCPLNPLVTQIAKAPVAVNRNVEIRFNIFS
jgi:hypothetical protein